MATRCLYGFKKGNDYKLAYNHMDSYPSGFGKEFVSFIRENTLSELEDLYEKIVLVDRNELPNDNQIKLLIDKKMYYKDDGKILNWEEIFYENGTILEYYTKDFYIMPSYNDWIDGGFDYIYIINLDKKTFQVYRYSSSSEDKVIEDNLDCNFPSDALEKEFPLEKIPKDWYRSL